MRIALLAAAALLPTSLFAQYPASGTYKGYVQPVGTDGRFDLILRVEKAADSTVIKILQDPEQPPIPLSHQAVISGGFLVEMINLSCPLVVVAEEWEAVCADPFGNPAFSMRFSRKAELPAPAPAAATPG
jgi:hypothetical protein